MAHVDLVFRLFSVALIVSTSAVLYFKGFSRTRHGLLSCLLLVCTASFLAQPLATGLGSLRYLGYAVLILGFAWVFVFWLTTQVMFVPNFTPTILHLTILLLIEVLSFAAWNSNTPPDLFVPLNMVLPVIWAVLAIHAIWVVWQGRSDDLDPDRRRFRTLFATIALSISTLAFVDFLWTLLSDQAHHFGLSTLLATLILVGCLSLSLHLYQLMIGDPLAVRPTANQANMLSDPDEEAAFDILSAALVRRRLFCDETLTPSSLADFVGLPEDKVRQLLFIGYGERNFESLLDRFRIDAACSYLGDTEDSHRPIYEIAATVGYRSEATFSRAFITRTGVSPSQYRQQKIDDAAGDLKLQLTNSDR